MLVQHSNHHSTGDRDSRQEYSKKDKHISWLLIHGIQPSDHNGLRDIPVKMKFLRWHCWVAYRLAWHLWRHLSNLVWCTQYCLKFPVSNASWKSIGCSNKNSQLLQSVYWTNKFVKNLTHPYNRSILNQMWITGANVLKYLLHLSTRLSEEVLYVTGKKKHTQRVRGDIRSMLMLIVSNG